jgi:hypothetical protein
MPFSETEPFDLLQPHEPNSEQTQRRRRRYIIASCIVLLLLAGATAYYYTFCNVAMHSDAWTREHIDLAVRRGLDYLHASGAFGRSVDEGGETPPHFLFLEQVLRRYEHAPLRTQIARAKELNKRNVRWRMFLGMPGWPSDELTPQDYANIAHAVNHWEENFWAEWVLYGLYPGWTSLRPEEDMRLFQDTSLLADSYQLTHALLTYLWMKKSNRIAAKERQVDDRIREVNSRLWIAQSWDAFTSDIYNERVAFWLYMDEPPPIKRRWIERMILSQNVDGGWTYEKSILRLLGQFVGYDAGTGKSSSHATFLALYALAEYEGRLMAPPVSQ